MSYLLGILGFALSHVETPIELAGIEQLRSDILKDYGNQYIRQTAVDRNMRIARYKQMNRQWWTGFMIPDVWETVKFIEIPNTDWRGNAKD